MLEMFRFVRRSPGCNPCLLGVASVVVVIVVASGCGSNQQRAEAPKPGPMPEESVLNVQIVDLPFEQQIAAGAQTDRTIYAHHFVAESALLNRLGERQIDALLDIAGERPMRVNVMDAGSQDELHEARVAAVRERFLSAGVDEQRLQIVSGPPGGPGISSAVIISVIEKERSEADTGGTTTTNGGAGGARGDFSP